MSEQAVVTYGGTTPPAPTEVIMASAPPAPPAMPVISVAQSNGAEVPAPAPFHRFADLSNNNASEIGPVPLGFFQALKADGFDGVILKCSEGDNFTDAYFSQWAELALSLGLGVAAYHFDRGTPGAAQAAHALSVVDTVSEAIKVCVDFETLDAVTEVVATCDALADRLLWVYVNENYAEHDSATQLGSFPVWVASPGKEPDLTGTPWSDWTAWQQGQTTLNGVTFDTDVTKTLDGFYFSSGAPVVVPVSDPVSTPPEVDFVASLNWPLLQSGSRGDQVKLWQGLLVALGHRIAIDGIFGANTESATRAEQSNRGVAVDGIVGPVTLRAVLSA